MDTTEKMTNVTNKFFIDKGREGAEKRWQPIRTRKMELLQEMYKLKDKKLIDTLTANRTVEWLERFLQAIKQR